MSSHNYSTPNLQLAAPFVLVLRRALPTALAVLLCLIVTGFAAPSVGAVPLDSDRLARAVRASETPSVTARAAVLVDTDTGRVLWGTNAGRRLSMASTTKMMTALVVLRYAQPNETATVYPRDLVGGSTANLRAGERITIEELLYGALIPSGNDAAWVLADYVGRTYLGGVGDGGVPAFVEEMNVHARRLGLQDTNFVNPNGFDEPGHYSTALDLARLGRAVMSEPLLAEIVGSTRHTVVGYSPSGGGRKSVSHPVETTNELLGSYRGADGVKTGTTPSAGQVFVASVRRGDSAMIGVVIGSTDRFSDTRAMFDWGFATYEWLPLSARLFGPFVPTVIERLSPAAAVQRTNTAPSVPAWSASALVRRAATWHSAPPSPERTP